MPIITGRENVLAVYEEAAKNNQTEENKEESKESKDDDVVDAEFEEK